MWKEIRFNVKHIKLSFRRSLSVINVLSLSSAYVQLRPNPQPDATVREKKQARDSPRQTRPDRSRPASVRLSSSLIFGGPVQTYKTKSVPKKKGRLVGLGRRTRSVPPSSAPPPFVDPEVLTAQLKDKDDRISLLETQMAAQQAGYEAQRRLNQQMMEMMQRMYPNEMFSDVPDP
ncbi:hypothetical protein F2Q69_00003394 [Brassica cretica]|uniref:Uncharacterized protein n=1 Tax=Brassica cretica TaxID=69181 RepID=A0A8S9NMF9_BRACR|nr:hypothetical protein F2Q69_00003394 [Brassica cretica]